MVGQRHPSGRRCPADRRGHRRQRSGRHRAGGHGAGWHRAGWHGAGGHGDHCRLHERHGDEAARSGRALRPFVQLRDLVVRLGGLLALGGVNLDVARGERLAVLGPNGAGKTTLFNVIAGDLHPTSGTVVINGADCTTAPSRHRPKLGVARTYQKTRLFPGLTVEDNLQLAWIGKPAATGRCAPTAGAVLAGRQHEPRPRRVARRPARLSRRRPLPRPAASARGRHGGRHRTGVDDARRARLRVCPAASANG